MDLLSNIGSPVPQTKHFKLSRQLSQMNVRKDKKGKREQSKQDIIKVVSDDSQSPGKLASDIDLQVGKSSLDDSFNSLKKRIGGLTVKEYKQVTLDMFRQLSFIKTVTANSTY